jgi:tetratricopeptide (TPR) repeat protein
METGDRPVLRPPSMNARRPVAPRLQPPGMSPPPVESSGIVRHWLWAALVLALLLALAVVFLPPPPVFREASDVDPDHPLEPATLPAATDETAARAQAGEILKAYLRQRARLELVHAADWGEPDWSQAAAAANAGDRLFSQRHFAEAAQSYADGLRRLEELAGQREQRLATALETGRQALESNDGTGAKARFALALAIDPDNAAAVHGMAQARVRSDVRKHLQSGRDAETAGDLAAARTAYQQAVALDAEYAPAAAALERVTQQLADAGFRAAMTRALAALDAGRLNEAGSALTEAAGLHPDDVALTDARRRLAAARRQVRLDGLRRTAAAQAGSENWARAAGLYRQALTLDPQAGFARDGLEQAQDRVRLHQQLDHYLDDPSRLHSAEPLANAEKLLVAAGEAPAGEPRLSAKIGQLRRQVALARTPVPVDLHSDGETTVVIYHVGSLGQFHDNRLELRPGTYTALGSRPGYRDVRIVFTVQPGAAPLSVEIHCRDPI